MKSHKGKFFIINRSFWPIYPVIGEALLRFAEHQAKTMSVGVILQDHAGIRKQLDLHGRGVGIAFYPVKAWSISSSGIARRIMDAIFFMIRVFWLLIRQRPGKVYVSTDPPVLVPFIVMAYSKLFGAKYIYHLQDIHPEAANVIIPINRLVFRIFRWLDGVTMRNASLLITVTDQMANEIKNRSHTKTSIVALMNPSVAFDEVNTPDQKKIGFTFCGNAGRLQRIPLLLTAIREYCQRGGRLPFVFAGSGVHSKEIARLADDWSNVEYKGLVSAKDAAQINSEYLWSLLPIEDEVTRYAFPSKSSSYVYSGAFIAAVCGKDTSVAEWVVKNRLGVVIPPDVELLVRFFCAVERGTLDVTEFDSKRRELKQQLNFDTFVGRLTKLSTNVERGDD